MNITNINNQLTLLYKQLKNNKKYKKDIENSFDILQTYQQEQIIDILNHLMEINYNIKDISHNINVLLNTRNNIINNSNNKIIEKKCPTHGEKIIIDQLKIFKSQNCVIE